MVDFDLAKNTFCKCFLELKNALVFNTKNDSSQICEKSLTLVFNLFYEGSILLTSTVSLKGLCRQSLLRDCVDSLKGLCRQSLLRDCVDSLKGMCRPSLKGLCRPSLLRDSVDRLF